MVANGVLVLYLPFFTVNSSISDDVLMSQGNGCKCSTR